MRRYSCTKARILAENTTPSSPSHVSFVCKVINTKVISKKSAELNKGTKLTKVPHNTCMHVVLCNVPSANPTMVCLTTETHVCSIFAMARLLSRHSASGNNGRGAHIRRMRYCSNTLMYKIRRPWCPACQLYSLFPCFPLPLSF